MNSVKWAVAGIALVGLAACTPVALSGFGAPEETAKQAAAYRGPKRRIAVADFEDKVLSQHYNPEFGRGMSDMLITALVQTNRFTVLERKSLQAVLAEQDLGASGRVKKETVAPPGEIEGAELLVTPVITAFEPDVAGKAGDLSSQPLGSLLGRITGTLKFQKAHVAVDLRVVDARTARVIAAGSAEGSAASFDAGGALAGGALSGSLSGFAKTPMETAIREMTRKAVEVIAAQTPQAD